jgi:hypothetical protein
MSASGKLVGGSQALLAYLIKALGLGDTEARQLRAGAVGLVGQGFTGYYEKLISGRYFMHLREQSKS